MTLVDLNQIEIDYLIHILRWHKQNMEDKKPLPKAIENQPIEIQSIIYKLEDAIEREDE